MSDRYIPKVGDECEVLNSKLLCPVYEKCIILFIGKHAVVYTSESCEERQARIGDLSFRPIPTKADVEREQLCELLEDSCAYVPNEGLAEEIQRLGFTIPKKVRRSELNAFLDKWYGEWLDDNDMAADELCELLGDLVEDEAND